MTDKIKFYFFNKSKNIIREYYNAAALMFLELILYNERYLQIQFILLQSEERYTSTLG